MSELGKAVLIALALLSVLCVIVGSVIRHYVGGFFETVAREEQEQAERFEAEKCAVETDARQGLDDKNETGASL